MAKKSGSSASGAPCDPRFGILPHAAGLTDEELDQGSRELRTLIKSVHSRPLLTLLCDFLEAVNRELLLRMSDRDEKRAGRILGELDGN